MRVSFHQDVQAALGRSLLLPARRLWLFYAGGALGLVGMAALAGWMITDARRIARGHESRPPRTSSRRPRTTSGATSRPMIYRCRREATACGCPESARPGHKRQRDLGEMTREPPQRGGRPAGKWP